MSVQKVRGRSYCDVIQNFKSSKIFLFFFQWTKNFPSASNCKHHIGWWNNPHLFVVWRKGTSKTIPKLLKKEIFKNRKKTKEHKQLWNPLYVACDWKIFRSWTKNLLLKNENYTQSTMHTCHRILNQKCHR